MKKMSILIFPILVLLSILYLSNSFAQDDTTSNLPEGAKARISSKGHLTRDIAYSPDGKRLAVASSMGVWIYDAQTGEELDFFTVRATSVSFSPNGQTLAVADVDNTIQLRDVRTHEHLHTLTGHTGSVKKILFSPDGQRLVTGSFGSLRLWNTHTGEFLYNFFAWNPLEGVNNISFQPTGQALVIANGFFLYDWDIQTQSIRRSPTGRSGSIQSLSPWSILTPLLTSTTSFPIVAVSGGNGFGFEVRDPDHIITLWSLNTGEILFKLTEHTDAVSCITFSPDGWTLASGSDDNTIRLWDVRTGRHLRTLTGHRSSITNISFNPDGQTLATSSTDGTIRLWNTRTGEYLLGFAGYEKISLVSLSPDGQTLAISSTDGTIRLWNTRTGENLYTLTGHTDQISWKWFSPDGQTLATSSTDGTIRLWNTRTGENLYTLTGRTDSVWKILISFSPDGQTLATITDDRTVHLWNARTGRSLRRLRGHTDRIIKVLFSSDGKTLTTKSDDGTIRLWDVRTGKYLRNTLTLGRKEVNSVSLTPDGQKFARINPDRTISLWDVKTGKRLHTLTRKSARSLDSEVLFSPDGQTLAFLDTNNTVQLWEVSTDEHLVPLKGRNTGSWRSFTPDGQTLATAPTNGPIQIWDVGTGEFLRTVPVAWSQREIALSSEMLATLDSTSNSVLLWEIPPPTLRGPIVQVDASQRPSMYWVDTQAGTLHRLLDDKVENLLPSVQNATHLAVDAAKRKIYWTEKTSKRAGKIKRANLDGSNIKLIKDLTSVPLNIALDSAARKLYLINAYGKIQRLNLDSSNFQSNLITDLKSPNYLTLDVTGGKIYWTEQTGNTMGKIQRANLDGTNVEFLKQLRSTPHGLAIDPGNNKLYLTNAYGKIQRLNLDGSNFQPNLITDLDDPQSLAVDSVGGKVYWTEQGSLRRADLNGDNIQKVVTRLGAPAGIALGIIMKVQAAPPAAPVTTIAPEQTLLLANYPNPFNPETWIPYQLAKPADVTLDIYAANGALVRTLAVGHQPAGIYHGRARAVYWNGKNAVGEPVASGIYFYTLTAGDFTATGKMLIRK